MAHAFSLDERLIHVPLVAAGPGAEELATCAASPSCPQSSPALGGIADHPWTKSAPGASLSGSSILRARRRRSESWSRAGSRRAAPEALRRSTSQLDFAADDRWKLLRSGDVVDAYYLDVDPLESHPVDRKSWWAKLARPLPLATARARPRGGRDVGPAQLNGRWGLRTRGVDLQRPHALAGDTVISTARESARQHDRSPVRCTRRFVGDEPSTA